MSLSEYKKVLAIAIITTAVGGSVIAILSRYLKRKGTNKKRSVAAKDEHKAKQQEALALDNALLQSPIELNNVAEAGDANVTASWRSISSLSRASSTATLGAYSSPSQNALQLCHLGDKHIQRAIVLWEEGLARLQLESNDALASRLKTVINNAKTLTNLYQAEFQSEVAVDAALNALQELDEAYDKKHVHSITDSEASIDTFVSAVEIADLSDLEEQLTERITSKNHLYEVGLLELQQNMVPYRKLRTNASGCSNDSEFLAKLHILRRALDGLMKKEKNRKWFMETIKVIITGILTKAQRDTNDFLSSMEQMEKFLALEPSFEILKIELETRGVKCFTLYDIAFDWILLDAFEDLSNPPSSVLSVVQNRWLSDGLKETAISTAVWSILKAKRRLLKYPDGFVSNFYNISETVSPIIAWGFFGPESDLKSACLTFKNQCEGFVKDLFDFRRVRYTVYEDMQSDIMAVAEQRASAILSALGLSSNYQNGRSSI